MQISPPVRVIRSHVQRLHAPPDRVFPLLCPVREADWIDGWDPRRVITQSGLAEPDCVFVTAAESADAIWVITRHEPDRFVEMLKVSPGVTVCRLTIALRAAGAGCDARAAIRLASDQTRPWLRAPPRAAQLPSAKMPPVPLQASRLRWPCSN